MGPSGLVLRVVLQKLVLLGASLYADPHVTNMNMVNSMTKKFTETAQDESPPLLRVPRNVVTFNGTMVAETLENSTWAADSTAWLPKLAATLPGSIEHGATTSRPVTTYSVHIRKHVYIGTFGMNTRTAISNAGIFSRTRKWWWLVTRRTRFVVALLICTLISSLMMRTLSLLFVRIVTGIIRCLIVSLMLNLYVLLPLYRVLVVIVLILHLNGRYVLSVMLYFKVL